MKHSNSRFDNIILKPHKFGFLDEIYFEHYKQKTQNDEVMLFLHGYPSEGERKNRDFLQKVFNFSPHIDCFLIHYPGLGNGKGEFHFSKTFQSAIKSHKYLTQVLNYNKVHVFGHSWGGFNTLNLIKNVSHIGTVVLASPFLKIPKNYGTQDFSQYIYEDTKKYLTHTNVDQIVADLNPYFEENNFHKNIMWLNQNQKSIHLIQAMVDQKTPPEIAKEFSSQLKTIRYQELPTDHSFEDSREKVADFILESLKLG